MLMMMRCLLFWLLARATFLILLALPVSRVAQNKAVKIRKNLLIYRYKPLNVLLW